MSAAGLGEFATDAAGKVERRGDVGTCPAGRAGESGKGRLQARSHTRSPSRDASPPIRTRTFIDMSDARTVPLDALVNTFGSAKHPGRAAEHPRPNGVTDATVDALGKLGAALEDMEDARGHLYAFHRLSGRADLDLQEAVHALRAAGHGHVADVVTEVLVGRDVLPGMWTFQIVEAYDRGYADVFRAVERSVRAELGVTFPHPGEAEMKVREQQ